MAEWRLHWLEAAGDLSDFRPIVISEVEAARSVVARMLPLPRLDILIQCGRGQVIPEIGLVGHAYRKTLFTLTIDPTNDNLARCLTDGTLRRHIAHEVHHCLRMDGPGFGRTLGEALVSEGLAGRFVSHLFATPPEPWECAVDDQTLQTRWPSADAPASSGYDHDAWFFGAGGTFPRWLGYTIGYALVGRWLPHRPDLDGSDWIDTPAATILAGAFAGKIGASAT